MIPNFLAEHRVVLFKDEIKPERGVVDTLAHGSLLVPEDYVAALYWSLERARGNTSGRIHSTDLSGTGQQFETARRWLRSFFEEHLPFISFKASFALQNGPLALPYPGDEGYEKHWSVSTKWNALAHVRYAYAKVPVVHVRPVFDMTGNAKERDWSRTGIDIARFEIGERRRKGKKYPDTQFAPVEFASSDHRQASTIDEAVHGTILQFTDVMLGAVADSLNFRPGASKAGRLQLARHVAEEIRARNGIPPFGLSRYQRHFSVSLYPDAHGRAYAANAPAVDSPPAGTQSRLISI